MTHDVFISYSSLDKAVADAVCAAIESRKVRCWMAPRDVMPGVPYAEALIDALNQSRLFVLVFSASSNESPQVMREVERAVNKGIPILPFRIQNVIPSKSMEYFVSASHWLDALTPPLEKHLQRLADTVQLMLTREQAPEQATGYTPPAAPTEKKRNNKLSYIVAVCAAVVIIAGGVIFLNTEPGKRMFGPHAVLPSNPPAAVPPNGSTVKPPLPAGVLPSNTISSGALFADDFKNPLSGWRRVSDEMMESDYINGQYNITVKKWDLKRLVVNRNAGQFGDMVLESTCGLVSGSNKGMYGLVFRYQDDNNYMCFMVGSDGGYTIQKRSNGVYSFLQKLTTSPFINQGNAANHLKVICKGSQITVDCNGHQLATYADTSFKEGWIGLIVNSADPPASAGFDNIKVSKVE